MEARSSQLQDSGSGVPLVSAGSSLTPVRRLRRSRLAAADGEVGLVEDVYFDDRSWRVRHLVVRARRWLPGRRVLVAPRSVIRIELHGRRLVTDLTRHQVEEGPSPDHALPVARQHAIAFAGYYGFPYSLHGPFAWEPGHAEPGLADADIHLRSSREVIGYGLGARDGMLGHVEDFLVDGHAWTIRYVVVDTRSWWPGASVLVPPDWITHIAWGERVVHVGVRRAALRRAPRWAA